ncbi:biotin--protein ligase [Ditylenchus destructor]|nr:biotin--protein ligase [Ditylenchus destructor]
MGGVLVSAGSRGDVFYCTISCGLNVVNSKPIGCINDLLPDEKKLCLEDVFAAVMNKFEYHVNQFQKGNKEEFLRKYHQYWLHTKEEVSIMHQDTTSIEKVIIQGVDEFGYLQVRSKDSGRVFSVHDDGNSFDMMKGLIHPKKYT